MLVRHITSDLAKDKSKFVVARIDFDYLVVATGARHSYFGKDQWAAHA